jgi:diguanylate cyclase (GGDEF)-like protein
MQEAGSPVANEAFSLPAAGQEDPSPVPDQPFLPPKPVVPLTEQLEPAPLAGRSEAGGDLLLGITLVLMVVIVLLAIRIFRDREQIREAREDRDAAQEEARHLRMLMTQMEKSAEIKSRHRVTRLLQRSQQAEREKEALEQINTRLRRLVQVDDLTGVANVQDLGHALDKELRRALRSKRPVSLVILDIDGFRRYNRQYGHDKGDDLLKRMAHLAQSVFRRGGDQVGRIAGDRFAVIAPETDYEDALAQAEHMRARVLESAIPSGDPAQGGRVTISLGVTTILPDRVFRPYQVFERAVLAMQLAKKRGGNGVRGDRAERPGPSAAGAGTATLFPAGVGDGSGRR